MLYRGRAEFDRRGAGETPLPFGIRRGLGTQPPRWGLGQSPIPIAMKLEILTPPLSSPIIPLMPSNHDSPHPPAGWIKTLIPYLTLFAMALALGGIALPILLPS